MRVTGSLWWKHTKGEVDLPGSTEYRLNLLKDLEEGSYLEFGEQGQCLGHAPAGIMQREGCEFFQECNQTSLWDRSRGSQGGRWRGPRHTSTETSWEDQSHTYRHDDQTIIEKQHLGDRNRSPNGETSHGLPVHGCHRPQACTRFGLPSHQTEN